MARKTVTETLLEEIEKAIAMPGMNQERLAEKANVCKTSISNFVRGKRGLNGVTIDTLAEYFGLELRPIASTSRKKKKPDLTVRRKSR